MKFIMAFFFSYILFFSIAVQAQIDTVIVEKYYISDANDATDTTAADAFGNGKLSPGSVTYRIYVDLAANCSLKKIYGDANHLLKIASDSVFFNHKTEGKSFGNEINKARFNDSPTVALDTWLSLGHATKNYHAGILKTEDTDGSILGGTNSGGLLMNGDSNAGIPLTSADGFLTTTVNASYSSFGIRDFTAGSDSTIFGQIVSGNQFITDSAYLQTNGAGATGPTSENRVLIAQLTTHGEISFELNIEVEEPDTISGGTKTIKYVANNNGSGEILSPYLTYPPICGCTDKRYLEYNSLYSCLISDSCKTLKVFGCLDPLACNYDPNANSLLQGFCCYPGNCQNRDLSLACPNLSGRYNVYPNPTQHVISFDFFSPGDYECSYQLIDLFGREIFKKYIGIVSGTVTEYADVSGFENGVYLLRMFIGNTFINKIVIKN